MQDVRKRLIAETRTKIAASVNDDQLIVQTVTTLDQLEQAANSLTKKAREWYGLYCPEAERAMKKHEEFVEKAAAKSRDQLLSELDLKETMGGMLSMNDVEILLAHLTLLNNLYKQKTALEAYLETLMQRRCPNITLLAGSKIGAQLLSHAGSLQRLASVPSGTLQLFGAETALFRHLKDKWHKAPKYGVLFNHPLIQKVPVAERGKAARSLADKLSICAKLDFFGGELKAPEYKQQLADKFGAWQ